MINPRNPNRNDLIIRSEIHDPQSMFSLGKAFAAATKRERGFSLSPKTSNIGRVGLVAEPYAGKSVFVQGMLSAYSNAITLENKINFVSEEKSHAEMLLYTVEAGFIRVSDARISLADVNKLSAVVTRMLEEQGLEGTDLIENAVFDFDGDYDAVWKFDKAGGRNRIVELYATPNFCDSTGFDEFIDEAGRLLPDMP